MQQCHTQIGTANNKKTFFVFSALDATRPARSWTSYDNIHNNFIRVIPMLPEQHWQCWHLWPVHFWCTKFPGSSNCLYQHRKLSHTGSILVFNSLLNRNCTFHDALMFHKQNHTLNHMFLPCLSMNYCQLHWTKRPASSTFLVFNQTSLSEFCPQINLLPWMNN